MFDRKWLHVMYAKNQQRIYQQIITINKFPGGNLIIYIDFFSLSIIIYGKIQHQLYDVFNQCQETLKVCKHFITIGINKSRLFDSDWKSKQFGTMGEDFVDGAVVRLFDRSVQFSVKLSRMMNSYVDAVVIENDGGIQNKVVGIHQVFGDSIDWVVRKDGYSRIHMT
jgi:hypothetical protein